jgi:hypothetical protein
MAGERTLSELALDLGSQMGDLVRNELRLARTEALESVSHIGGGIVTAAIGVAFAGAAVTMGLFAIAYALNETVPPWAGALIAALVGSIVAYVLIKSGLKAASLKNVSLPKTRRSVSHDLNLTKETHAS